RKCRVDAQPPGREVVGSGEQLLQEVERLFPLARQDVYARQQVQLIRASDRIRFRPTQRNAALTLGDGLGLPAGVGQRESTEPVALPIVRRVAQLSRELLRCRVAPY